jgi:predicted nucleotidyltransferase
MDIQVIKSVLTPVFEKLRDKIVASYLFGSVATKEANAASDIDIAVLLYSKGLNFVSDVRLALYADCCRALKRNDVDIVLLNRTKNIFLLDEIVRNGVVLFEGDTGLREEFESRILHDAIEFKQHRLKVMGF